MAKSIVDAFKSPIATVLGSVTVDQVAVALGALLAMNQAVIVPPMNSVFSPTMALVRAASLDVFQSRKGVL